MLLWYILWAYVSSVQHHGSNDKKVPEACDIKNVLPDTTILRLLAKVITVCIYFMYKQQMK